jgi:hypothetical protein
MEHHLDKMEPVIMTATVFFSLLLFVAVSVPAAIRAKIRTAFPVKYVDPPSFLNRDAVVNICLSVLRAHLAQVGAHGGTNVANTSDSCSSLHASCVACNCFLFTACSHSPCAFNNRTRHALAQLFLQSSDLLSSPCAFNDRTRHARDMHSHTVVRLTCIGADKRTHHQ